MPVTIHPLTPERWPDLETLFGARGGCAGCWCMFFRLRRAEWERQRGEGNRAAFRRRVAEGPPPGLLAYSGDQPVGWCAVAPREEYPVLERSRVARRVDEQPVWSVTCFFVARPFRRQGITVQLLDAASEYARRNGASIVEGYPHETTGGQADAFVYMGLASAFRKAGFTEAARHTPKRPLMRRSV